MLPFKPKLPNICTPQVGSKARSSSESPLGLHPTSLDTTTPRFPIPQPNGGYQRIKKGVFIGALNKYDNGFSEEQYTITVKRALELYREYRLSAVTDFVRAEPSEDYGKAITQACLRSNDALITLD